ALATDEDRAFRGLAACPCAEATEALLRLYDALPAPRRWQVADELLLRAAPPAPSTSVSPAFLARSWSDRLRAPLLERARAAIAGTDPDGIAFGAEAIRRYGDASDVPRLVAALERTVGTPAPEGHYAVGQLLWPLARWPDAAVRAQTADPRVRALLDLVPRDGRTDAPGPQVLRAMRSGDPLVAKVACERAPALTPELVAAAIPWLGTEDPLLAHRLGRLLGTAPLSPLLAALPDAPPAQAAALLTLLRPRLPADAWLELALAHPSVEVATMLPSLLACRGGGRFPPPAPADVPTVSAAWARVLAEQRDALAAGRLAIVPGRTDPALVWPGWRCDRPPWP
ncbi:MAG: hypothetical protein R3F59_38925, partial [Myxococcota bacterium]